MLGILNISQAEKTRGEKMKVQSWKLAAVLAAGLIVLGVPAGLTASELRVIQLGQAWLVPDAYYDMIVNPARLAMLETNLFQAGLRHSLSKTNSDVMSDNTFWYEFPSLSYAGKFGGINAGIMHGTGYASAWKNTRQRTSLLINNTVVSAAMKIDSLSAGFAAGFIAINDGMSNEMREYSGSLRGGLNLSMESMEFGGVIYASNEFNGVPNCSGGIKLLLEIRPDAGSVVRVLCDTSYAYTRQNPELDTVANPFGDEFIGTYGGSNTTAISYTGAIDKTNCFIGISNSWIPYNAQIEAFAGPASENITQDTDRSEILRIKAGLETRFLADWLTVRASCEPISLRYQESYIREKSYGATVSESRQILTGADIFDTDAFSFGLGIKLGEGMLLDISLTGSSPGHYEKDQSAYATDEYTESISNEINAQFTMSW